MPVNFPRRMFLGSGFALGAGAFPGLVRASDPPARVLRAVTARHSLVGEGYPPTEVWSYDGKIPGPVLNYRQGERLRITFENHLPEASTVHFHGIRLPNAMDGVPHLTQTPVEPGAKFQYEFDLPDAGTYWYHPHLGSAEQVGRGLSGALIVQEHAPPAVDRELLWVLSDWRLDREARIVPNFGNFMDASHAGRIGNTVSVNGSLPESIDVNPGERLRLRLVNASNARIYGLNFQGHDPVVIAYDGHPVAPHRPERGRVVLGPAMRADLILDLAGESGRNYPVVDDYYPRLAYRLLDLRYSKNTRAGRAGSALQPLAPNPVAEPVLERAERHQIVFGGGMMGSMPRQPAARGMIWTVNGQPVHEHDAKPILSLELGRTALIELVNDTMWPHPIHLHGHVFRVVSRDGSPTLHREWRDTVLLEARQRAEIAFVADNPGVWMLHCHVLEHQASGMMAAIRVA